MYDAPPGLLTILGWIVAGFVALLGVARAVAVERRAGRPGAGGAGAPKEMSGVGVAFTVLTALAVGSVAGVLAAVVAAGLG